MNESDNFDSLFAPEPAAAKPTPLIAPWKVLLVDDEADIHAVLRLALQDFVIEGRALQLLDAKSAAETRVCLAEHPDIALILLDVVMETEQAGLELVRHIRQDIGNRIVQIVLVTGQPGYAPQREVVAAYAIDGYRLKSELTADKIFVSVYAALRTYQALLELAQHRYHLESLVEERTLALSLAKAAAEAASRAKSTFLANMSHELRTPLNGIMGMTGIALRHAEDPTLRDQLSKIDHASHHLLGVINDILDISKIEAERLILEQVTFKFGEVLTNLMSLIGHKATDKQLKLRVDLSPEVTSLSLLGDPLRLGQILLNLTGNAIKFTETGSITLRARLIEDKPADVLLRIEVTDTGIGIAADDQQRLFTAFEQADGSMTRKYGGTGLGLAISKRLAKLMGGDVGVESQLGSGSTFWLIVRLGKAPIAHGAVPLAPTFSGQAADERLLDDYAGTRILLAEDEPINQEVSRGLLQDAGLVVDLADDGQQAVDMAKQNHYALILMDMQMPKLNGVDATRIIRTLPGYGQTPILAMTANAFDEDRQVCLDSGMNDHIAKPVDPEVLFETLLKWLEQPQPPAPATQDDKE